MTTLTPPTSATLVSLLFVLTYVGLAAGRIPGLKIDRAGIALVGASAMLCSGILSIQEAAGSIDSQTILLLFGMMVVAAYLQLSGFFILAADAAAARFHHPLALLAATIGVSGVLSAFLVNDVVCVALTPLVLDLCRRSRRPPIPYLIGLATASNVGSVATITGNPQNVLIGSFSQIPYLRFSAKLAPVAILGLVLNFLVVAGVYRRALQSSGIPLHQPGERRAHIHPPLLTKSLSVTLIAVVLFFAGLPIALVAIGSAAVLLLSNVRPSKVYAIIDWPLLVLFAGLFIVVHAFERDVVHTWGLERWTVIQDSPVAFISGLSLLLSNLVSNVPAVLLFKPLIVEFQEAAAEQAWLTLAMSSTLAGNLTLLGSVANLIVVESARRVGEELGFVEYLKVGVPLTILTTLLGMAWLAWAPY